MSGTKVWNFPEKEAAVNATSPPMTMNRVGAHQMGSIPLRWFPPRRMRPLLLCLLIGYPDRLKLPDCPYTDSEIIRHTKAVTIIDDRTDWPTASPRPPGRRSR